MQRSLVLAAIASACAAGCSRNSATVAGDPFLNSASDHRVVARQVDTVTNGQVPAIGAPEQSIGVDAPDGTQVRQTVFIDRDGQKYGDAEVVDPAATSPDKSEWWNSPEAVNANSNEPIKIPPQGGVNGRVNTFSMSYGMGHTIKP